MKTGLIASAVALPAYVLLHWSGIGLDPDSWAAWQGAVSIVAGKGYTYFSGNPIHSWPPLYSLYLAAWIAAIGPTALTLMIANAALVVLQAAAWQRLWRTLARDSGLAVGTPLAILLAVFIGLFLAVHEQSVFSHNLVLAFLPVFLLLAWRLVSPQPRPIGVVNGAALVTLASAMLLTHTSAIAFLVAGAAVLAIRRRGTRDSLLLGFLLGAVPVVLWLAVRHALDQGDSHYIGLGAGRYGVLAYAIQLLDGPGSLLVPAKLGAQFVAIVLLWAAALALAAAPTASGLRFGLLIAAISLAVLFVLFNLTWIFASMAGRFVLFVPLILVPLACATAWPHRPRVATLAAALAIVPQAYWLGSWGTRQLTQSLAELSFPAQFVPANAYISRDYADGPPVSTGRRLLVAPDPAIEEPRLRRQ
jgi:hypothetical protein